MLDNDDIILENASETVEKIPKDEKDYYICSLFVSV